MRASRARVPCVTHALPCRPRVTFYVSKGHEKYLSSTSLIKASGSRLVEGELAMATVRSDHRPISRSLQQRTCILSQFWGSGICSGSPWANTEVLAVPSGGSGGVCRRLFQCPLLGSWPLLHLQSQRLRPPTSASAAVSAPTAPLPSPAPEDLGDSTEPSWTARDGHLLSGSLAESHRRSPLGHVR